MHRPDLYLCEPEGRQPDGPISFEDRLAAGRARRAAQLPGATASASQSERMPRIVLAPPPPPAPEPEPEPLIAPPASRARIRLAAAALVPLLIGAAGLLLQTAPDGPAPLAAAFLPATARAIPAAIPSDAFAPALRDLAAAVRPERAARPRIRLDIDRMRDDGLAATIPRMAEDLPIPDRAGRLLRVRFETVAEAAQTRLPVRNRNPVGTLTSRTLQKAETPPAYRPAAVAAPEERPVAISDAVEPPATAVLSVPVRVLLERPTQSADSLPDFRPAPVDVSAPEPVVVARTVEAPAPAGDRRSPGVPAQPTVYIHVPPGVPSSAVRSVSDSLAATGQARIRVIPVAFRVSETHVRYYRPEDASDAEATIGAVARAYPGPRGGAPRDFSFYEPRPAPGTIEVWLRGG